MRLPTDAAIARAIFLGWIVLAPLLVLLGDAAGIEYPGWLRILVTVLWLVAGAVWAVGARRRSRA